jgi:hypothetical protein
MTVQLLAALAAQFDWRNCVARLERGQRSLARRLGHRDAVNANRSATSYRTTFSHFLAEPLA